MNELQFVWPGTVRRESAAVFKATVVVSRLGLLVCRRLSVVRDSSLQSSAAMLSSSSSSSSSFVVAISLMKECNALMTSAVAYVTSRHVSRRHSEMSI